MVEIEELLKGEVLELNKKERPLQGYILIKIGNSYQRLPFKLSSKDIKIGGGDEVWIRVPKVVLDNKRQEIGVILE